MASTLPPSLQLVTTLASHCALRSSEVLQSAGDQAQLAMQGLPARFPPGPQHDMAWELARDPLKCMEALKARYGGVVGFKLALRPVVLVSSQAYAREVFITQSSTFVKAGTAFFPGSSLAGNGLLVSDGDIWRRQRRLSNPAFRRAAINTYAQVMVKSTSTMMEEWLRGGVRDVYADFNELTMKILATSLFGVCEGSEAVADVGPAITSAFQFFTQRATSMFIVPEWVPTLDNIQYQSAVRSLDRVVYQLIAERREQLAVLSQSSLASSSQDLLTKLLQARDEDGSGMDDKSLRDELMTLLVAGQETSSILLAWSLLMLALHPHTQQQLYQEIVEMGTRLLRIWVRYTEAFIWETMRLMPPAYILGRCASSTTQIGEWNVPAGTTVLVSTYLLHRDPAVWPCALEFDPTRWLPGGNAKEHMENDSYWPFGGGPRNCIAMGFAMLEVSLVLATIAGRFKVSLPDGAPVPKPQAMITLRPENQVKLALTPRCTGKAKGTRRS